jgi:hypothetical protein
MRDIAAFSRVRKADPASQTTAAKTRRLPPDIVARAAHRVGTAALTWAGAYVAAIGLNEWAAHRLGDLPPHGWNLGHTVAALFVAVSLGLFTISRSRSLSPERLLDLGLAYEVVGGFAIVLGTSAGMVWDPRAHILGLPWICVWIAGFPFVVPATPGRASVAAFLTALMAPLGLAAWHVLSGTPMPDARIWSGIFIPSLLCAGIATIGSRIVYGLGKDIEQAREMGAYRLEERLGQGGMGEIWRARHHMLARPAAIKLVRPDAFGSHAARQSAVARFSREAQITARLSSPHTVRLYDFGVTSEGTFYYAMELLEGMDLDSLVRRHGPVPPERAVFFLLQACRSLAEAHALGLVHRDIKPANLFACRQGQEYDVLKVLDFGLVRPTSSEVARLTGKEGVVGTPGYMAPENATGDEVGPQSDIYSLGCVGYWLLSGQPVFPGGKPIDVLLRHVRDKPVPLRARAEVPIPEALDEAILGCLAKEPKRRPQSAEALGRILEAIAFDRPWTRTRARDSWKAHGSDSGDTPLTREESG